MPTVVSVPFGDGTVTIGVGPLAFECEVLGGKITHAYEDVGESRTMMCGTKRKAKKVRTDGTAFNLENDLSSAGLYAYCILNDLTEQPIEYVPNVANGAKWAGTVEVTLPSEIGADKHGSPIISSVTWAFIDHVIFTPAAAATI